MNPDAQAQIDLLVKTYVCHDDSKYNSDGLGVKNKAMSIVLEIKDGI